METLITRIEDLKAVLGGIQKTMTWGVWEPGVRGAALAYVVPAVGDELYAELVGTSTPAAKVKRLVELLKYAEGFYAYYDMYPQLVQVTGDSGAALATPDKTAPMSKWLYFFTRQDLQAKAEKWLEQALEYLEKNADAFPTWKQSEFYTVSKRLFIASSVEMKAAFPASKGSRRFWIAIRDYVQQAQRDTIRPLIGPELYDDLLTKLATPAVALSLQEEEAVRLIRECLANHAVFKSLAYLNLNEDFRILQEKDAVFNEAPSDNRVATMWQSCQGTARAKAAELKKYLDETATDQVLTAYYNSATRQSDAPRPYTPLPNDPSKPYFSL